MSIRTARKQNKEKSTALLDVIVNAISDKKGEQIISLDLRKTGDAVADFFIICHGTSKVQVMAIADHITEKTKEILGERPWHQEGFENYEWVLLDYIDIVVHVFIQEKREFYQLEDLWNDALTTEHF